MSYDEHDAAMDEFYDQISAELYPEHKEQAIEEFTEKKLKSYYLQNPDVMRPAVDAIQEGNELLSKVVFRAMNQAATWSTFVTSNPSLNWIPVTTFAR